MVISVIIISVINLFISSSNSRAVPVVVREDRRMWYNSVIRLVRFNRKIVLKVGYTIGLTVRV
jgi:hypothetical protein